MTNQLVDPLNIDDQEQWENATEGIVFINKMAGDGTTQERQIAVRSGKTIVLSPGERKLLNSDRCYAASADPFLNGTLVPLTLAASSTDVVENPNHLSGSSLEDMFSIRNIPKFKKLLKEIDSSALLHTLRNLTSREDLNATVGQVKAIQDRLDAVEKPFTADFIPKEPSDAERNRFPSQDR